MKKRVGIIGGMGPLATVDIFGKIVAMTKAEDDCDHVHLLIDSNTDIPSRIEAIMGDGADPLPEMVATAKRLEVAGADVLMIACNTAHYYYDGIAKAVDVPVINMLTETAKVCRRDDYKKVALLATDMVHKTGLYREAFEAAGVPYVLPSDALQARLMWLIFEGVKKNDFTLDIGDIVDGLTAMRDGGVDIFVLGCTELPVAFERYGIDLPALDPTRILAAAAIEAAGCELL